MPRCSFIWPATPKLAPLPADHPTPAWNTACKSSARCFAPREPLPLCSKPPASPSAALALCAVPTCPPTRTRPSWTSGWAGTIGDMNLFPKPLKMPGVLLRGPAPAPGVVRLLPRQRKIPPRPAKMRLLPHFHPPQHPPPPAWRHPHRRGSGHHPGRVGGRGVHKPKPL